MALHGPHHDALKSTSSGPAPLAKSSCSACSSLSIAITPTGAAAAAAPACGSAGNTCGGGASGGDAKSWVCMAAAESEAVGVPDDAN